MEPTTVGALAYGVGTLSQEGVNFEEKREGREKQSTPYGALRSGMQNPSRRRLGRDQGGRGGLGSSLRYQRRAWQSRKKVGDVRSGSR